MTTVAAYLNRRLHSEAIHDLRAPAAQAGTGTDFRRNIGIPANSGTGEEAQGLIGPPSKVTKGGRPVAGEVS
jgi:hypothetical protein